MKLSGCLIVVPEFIYEVIHELGLPNERMLDIEALAEYFNKESLAKFVAINEYILQSKFTLGTLNPLMDLVAIKDTLKPFEFTNSLSTTFAKDIIDNVTVILNKFNASQQYGSHEIIVETLLNIPTQDIDLKLPNYVYEVFYIKENHFGLRLVPKPIEIDQNPSYVLERNLSLLNKHYKYEELVKTQLFRRWCNFTLQQF